MGYDESLAERLVDATAHLPDVTTRKMFGGFAVMTRGNMIGGVMGEELIVRVGPDLQAEALSRSGAGMWHFGGRAPRGMVLVAADQVASQEAVDEWVALAERFVATLPGK